MKTDSCRIIGGRWRGRKVTFNDAEGLRPSTDRVRETLFNWLQAYVAGSRCLDLFAGSGVLGFEALSRGAADCVFVENNRKTVAGLRQNAESLGAENAEIIQADALRWLRETEPGQRFDLVFLDPPFASSLLEKSAAGLESRGLLAEDALVYVEHARGDEVEIPVNWQCLKQKKAGQVIYRLYAKTG